MDADKTILVMYTGGLDSMGALHHLLTHTTNRIHVHHIHLRNPEHRWKAEQIAVKNSIPLLRQIRQFRFSESGYSFSFGRFGNDSDIAAFVAAQLLYNDPKIRYVCFGVSADDIIREENAPSENRRGQTKAILHAALTNHRRGDEVETIYPIINTTKKELVESILPKELVDVSWSCRTPVEVNNTFTRCGECITCRHFKNVGLYEKTPSVAKD